MINLLFTISTAEGGFVMLLEDLVVHTQVSRSWLRQQASRTRNRFCEEEKLSPNHAADRSPENVARRFSESMASSILR
jgi:hypothetical protein